MSPLGPLQHACRRPEFQGESPARPRRRRCLLKDCDRSFIPVHPFGRYCSSACRKEARNWSIQKANARYRASEGGKACRREQSCRYRQRLKEGRSCAESEEREGYHKAAIRKKFCCNRPGCYERFDRTSRSPLKTFCSAACRQALRRVLVRESRWRVRLGIL